MLLLDNDLAQNWSSGSSSAGAKVPFMLCEVQAKSSMNLSSLPCGQALAVTGSHLHTQLRKDLCIVLLTNSENLGLDRAILAYVPKGHICRSISMSLSSGTSFREFVRG